MVYHVGNMLLQETQELLHGKVNDVIVCQDMNAVSKTYYTVLVIHNHNTARHLLEIYDYAGERAKQSYINGYSWKDNYLMIFPYQQERPIEQFFFSVVHTLSECEQLCIHIIMECIASGIPYPILYLQLEQNQLHLQQDGNVSLGYNLDLSGLSAMKSEKDCATLCAKKLFHLLEHFSTVKTTTYRLLELKNQRDGYASLMDLYKDMNAAAIPLEKRRWLDRWKSFWRRNKDRLFRFLLVICITAAIIAVIMILSQLIFADVPLFRLFVNTFKKIGTESLID